MKLLVSFFVLKILAHIALGMMCFYAECWLFGVVFCVLAALTVICMAALVKVHSPIDCSPENLPGAAPLKSPQPSSLASRGDRFCAGYLLFFPLLLSGCEDKELAHTALDFSGLAILVLLAVATGFARRSLRRPPAPRWVTAEEAEEGFRMVRSAIPVSQEELRLAKRVAETPGPMIFPEHTTKNTHTNDA